MNQSCILASAGRPRHSASLASPPTGPAPPLLLPAIRTRSPYISTGVMHVSFCRRSLSSSCPPAFQPDSARSHAPVHMPLRGCETIGQAPPALRLYPSCVSWCPGSFSRKCAVYQSACGCDVFPKFGVPLSSHRHPCAMHVFRRMDFLDQHVTYNAQDHQIVVPLLTANGVVEHVYFSKGALYWIR